MSRKRTGAKEFKRGRWIVKLTVDLRGGGTERRTFSLPKGTTEEQAEQRRKSLAAKAAGKLFEPREPIDAEEAALTYEVFVPRWLKSRTARGLRSVRKDRQRLRDHVQPVLLGKLMRSIGSDDLRRVVVELDRKIHDPEIQFSWKTAQKTWGAVTKLFKDAARSKDPKLRVLRQNPCDGVEGPDRGAEKAKQWLYPREFSTLVTCADVPLRWRRIYSVAAYLYLRLGEARALQWEDLDLVHWMAHVHRSTDERGKRVRNYTKTSSVRVFRIEPALRPLLTAMALESSGAGPVFGSIDKASSELRAHLTRAGIRRDALHFGTETTLAMRFHDLRATGITWAALRGDTTIAIRDRAGHTEVDQTDEYMRRASGAGDVGAPFPELDALVESSPGIVPAAASIAEAASIPDVPLCEGGDLKPRPGSEYGESRDEIAPDGSPEEPPATPGDNSGDNSTPGGWALALAAESALGPARVAVHRALAVRRRRRRMEAG